MAARQCTAMTCLLHRAGSSKMASSASSESDWVHGRNECKRTRVVAAHAHPFSVRDGGGRALIQNIGSCSNVLVVTTRSKKPSTKGNDSPGGETTRAPCNGDANMGLPAYRCPEGSATVPPSPSHDRALNPFGGPLQQNTIHGAAIPYANQRIPGGETTSTDGPFSMSRHTNLHERLSK